MAGVDRLVGSIVDGLMREELRSTEAAAQRLLVALGSSGLRERCVREVHHVGERDGLEKRVRLLVDGTPVWEATRTWRGGEGRFETRWLVDPESLARIRGVAQELDRSGTT